MFQRSVLAAMIEEILPRSVVVEEAREDELHVVLFPGEEEAVERAVEKRRREFMTARACAHRALARLNLPQQPIPAGPKGEPCWPAGVVGSITHCRGYRACALARVADLHGVGIDAEPNDPLPDGVLADIACAEELAWVSGQARLAPEVSWDRLLFCAKESVYKVWFPLAGSWLGFEDAIVTIDPLHGTFSARLLVPWPRRVRTRVTRLQGQWLVRDGLLLAAVTLA